MPDYARDLPKLKNAFPFLYGALRGYDTATDVEFIGGVYAALHDAWRADPAEPWVPRYLAHVRTLIGEKMHSAPFNALVDSYVAMIDAEVQADPKKLYTYANFLTEVNALKSYITNRRNTLMANSEVAQPAPAISSVEHVVAGTAWQAPLPNESPVVRATVTSGNGVFSVRLYHGTGTRISDHWHALTTALEEGQELLLPLFIILAVLQAHFIYNSDADDAAPLARHREL